MGRVMGKGTVVAKSKTKKRIAPEHALFKKHIGHNKHMCDLVSRRMMDQAATLSKGAKYICHICGRAAAKAANLCEPVEI